MCPFDSSLSPLLDYKCRNHCWSCTIMSPRPRFCLSHRHSINTVLVCQWMNENWHPKAHYNNLISSYKSSWVQCGEAQTKTEPWLTWLFMPKVGKAVAWREKRGHQGQLLLAWGPHLSWQQDSRTWASGCPSLQESKAEVCSRESDISLERAPVLDGPISVGLMTPHWASHMMSHLPNDRKLPEQLWPPFFYHKGVWADTVWTNFLIKMNIK